MILDKYGNEASPGDRSICPSCDGEIIAKCGPIVTHHWAHKIAECDSWAEPESEWHREWKRWFRDACGANIEVPMGEHRADVVLPNGAIIELQHRYQNVEQIQARESFYGRQMAWIYHCTWWDRVKPTASVRFHRWLHPDGCSENGHMQPGLEDLMDCACYPRPDHSPNGVMFCDNHYGRWKHAAKSMFAHQRSVWWDMTDAIEFGFGLPDLVCVKTFPSRFGGTMMKCEQTRQKYDLERRFGVAA